MTMACKCNKLLKLELNFSLVLQSYDPKIYHFRHFFQNDYKLIFDNLLQKIVDLKNLNHEMNNIYNLFKINYCTYKYKQKIFTQS